MLVGAARVVVNLPYKERKFQYHIDHQSYKMMNIKTFILICFLIDFANNLPVPAPQINGSGVSGGKVDYLNINGGDIIRMTFICSKIKVL